ncbi:NAD-dependent epimerase/dehydratase family protein [Sphingomonas sp. BT-65]|uniref:NAD-dependent epimerase/dehydratase family protein n=1 Tax=Sphingomonas sp. BT-65 TaxID=2989821 RepID=UPI0022357AA0|nr:NAD-dependent epimerase/dehydratase family protein [Sphingomonas sp. BT-65]MCW4463457.1 NAD-dependent epimerase/dehydratase family protein [Sphingomonas sp. BT-65]
MTQFLVTGSAGFIGFHLARRLLAEGHQVTGYDALTNYYDPALKRARNAILEAYPGYSFTEALLEDRDELMRAAEKRPPEVIVHLAAQAGVRYSIDAPATYVSSNLTGSWAVLELARAVRPRHLLMASTSSAYGANEKVPFGETDRADHPMSLYAATKKGMEAMAHAYAHLFAIPSTLFRFFTVYGPWGRPDMALFKFTSAILAGRPIEVYGNGRMARDFTYVDDLVEAIVRLVDAMPVQGAPADAGGVVDSLSPVASYRVVNIAGGHPVELMDFIRTVEACIGRQARLDMLPMQAGDVPLTAADPSLLRALTCYVPSTGIADGVAAFVDWYCRYHGVSRARDGGETARATVAI